jgi:hypothetical protein
MGIGYEYGPPREDLKKPWGGQTWFGKRMLSVEQMRELARAIESWGGVIGEESDVRLSIEGEHEAFVVQPSGGYLSKPNVGGEDEHERLWELACSICDWAGWIIVGDELLFGGTMSCATCGAEGDPCPNDHDDRDLRITLTVSPPEENAAPRQTPLDALEKASTAAELRAALAGRAPPFDDPDCAVALLLSDDDEIVLGALSAIERAPAATIAARRALIDTRLRRIAMLADDPALGERAAKLRGRLPR